MDVIVQNDGQTVIADGVEYAFKTKPLPGWGGVCKLCDLKGNIQACKAAPCMNLVDDIDGYYVKK